MDKWGQLLLTATGKVWGVEKVWKELAYCSGYNE